MGRNDTNIAIYGGSFDPPHLGHKEVVKKTLSILDIDKVIIVPSWLNPFKNSSHALAKKRFEWTKEMFKDIDNVEVSDFEISQNKAVYTIETFEALNQKYPISHIIIGADNLKSLTKWRDFEKLNQSIEWIIAKRQGYDIVTPSLHNFKVIETDIPISSSEIRMGKGLEFIDDKIIDEVKYIYKL